MYSILFLFSAFIGAYSLPVNERIVNGTDAFPGEIPYIVSLRFNNSHTCGASILNEYWMLTAAHCVYDRDPTQFSIQFGTTRISKDDSFSRSIEKIAFHPAYVDHSGHINDVAVVKVKDPIPLGTFVRPTVLPPALNATPEWADATLAGWGLPYTNGSVMDLLQVVDLTVYSDNDCERIHARTGPTNRWYHICAGIPEGGKGQCNGDSGGPLTVGGVQVGLVSWSVKPCARSGYPGVYTKVARHVDWILQNIAS